MIAELFAPFLFFVTVGAIVACALNLAFLLFRRDHRTGRSCNPPEAPLVQPERRPERALNRPAGQPAPAYTSRGHLLTATESDFYAVLRPALPPELEVHAKVRLADLVAPAVEPRERGFLALFGRIKSKHVDFVLCEAGMLRIRGVIELDDPSHQRPDRQARDAFVDAALAGSGIPVMHVPVARSYGLHTLERIFSGLGLDPIPSGGGWLEDSDLRYAPSGYAEALAEAERMVDERSGAERREGT